MDHLELAFDSKTGYLAEAYLHPKKMTWDQCKQLWGEKFDTVTTLDGSQSRIFTAERVRVLLDKDDSVRNVGIY